MPRRRAEPSAPTPEDRASGGDGPSFEQALERLETIVERLEAGELELEEALSTFEEGVALTRRCAGQIEAAERRIEELVEEGGRWLARPFEEEEEVG